MTPPRRVAVVGHVEHVSLARVPALPAPGDIVHIDQPITFPGGGGGVAYAQLARSAAEAHLFTAFGTGDAGDEAAREIGRAGRVHAARRDVPHPRSVVLVTPDGERTILVVGAPLHPHASDALPWELLAGCDCAYFTGEDPDTLRAARAARVLVVTARRRAALVRSGVRADVVVGSARDPREASALADYPVPPGALVLTEGAQGGRIETAAGVVRFAAPPSPPVLGAAYGAGDTFAAALTWYVAAGSSVRDACARAGVHGAAVLAGLDPRSSQLPLPPT
ncbi:MAG TPA: sugar kinase [Anaeromyxobacteraceae bacterium]|nr:sugar kinase [Anaeromyxobacteraceae bacterium]